MNPCSEDLSSISVSVMPQVEATLPSLFSFCFSLSELTTNIPSSFPAYEIHAIIGYSTRKQTGCLYLENYKSLGLN